MTQEVRDSTYFDTTDPSSTEWDDIASLGRAIVDHLRLDDFDVLGRWMSYRIAELIDGAEASAPVREEATRLILEVWRHRTDWPNGWLPRGYHHQLKWLLGEDEPSNRRQRAVLRPKEALVQDIIRSLREEYGFWMSVAGAQLDEAAVADPLARWETPDGRALLRRIAAIQGSPGASDSFDAKPSSPVEGQQERLSRIFAQRSQQLGQLQELVAGETLED